MSKPRKKTIEVTPQPQVHVCIPTTDDKYDFGGETDLQNCACGNIIKLQKSSGWRWDYIVIEFAKCWACNHTVSTTTLCPTTCGTDCKICSKCNQIVVDEHNKHPSKKSVGWFNGDFTNPELKKFCAKVKSGKIKLGFKLRRYEPRDKNSAEILERVNFLPQDRFGLLKEVEVLDL